MVRSLADRTFQLRPAPPGAQEALAVGRRRRARREEGEALQREPVGHYVFSNSELERILF